MLGSEPRWSRHFRAGDFPTPYLEGNAMSKKDILKVARYLPTKVGDTVYVWSDGGKKPTGDRECVISAHGQQTWITSEGKKPQVTLYYYCPNGYTLNDPGVDDIASGKTRWFEKVEPGAA